jgi:hypothetical protein
MNDTPEQRERLQQLYAQIDAQIVKDQAKKVKPADRRHHDEPVAVERRTGKDRRKGQR